MGKGAPSAPSVSFVKPQTQQSGLSGDQMKGLGVLGNNLSGGDVSASDLGSSSSPLPGLDASDYQGYGPGGNYIGPTFSGLGSSDAGSVSDFSSNLYGLSQGLSPSDIFAKGGRVKRYAFGGYADGGGPDDETFDDRFYDRAAEPFLREVSRPGAYSHDLGYGVRSLDVPTTAGVGASSPAVVDDPTADQGPFDMGRDPDKAHTDWQGRTDRDTGRTRSLAAAAQNTPAPDLVSPPTDEVMTAENDNQPPVSGVSGLPNVIRTGRSAPQVAQGAPSGVSAYSAAPETDEAPEPPETHGAVQSPAFRTAPPSQPGGGGFLEGLGVHVTPELRQGLLQAGLAMMASTRGGPGSFLGAVGEGGMAGVGAYGKSLELAQKQAEQERQDAIEAEKLRMSEESHAQQMASSPLIRGPNGQMVTNKALLDYERQKAEINAKDNWKLLQGDGVSTPDRLYNSATGEVKNVPAGTGPAALAAMPEGTFDYRTGSPSIQKGDTVPEPPAIVGHSPDLLKRDAEYFLTTGQLPKGSVSPRNAAGIGQMNYVRAVQNYAVALAASRGMNMAQMADLQRFGTQAAKFPLSQQGNQTVAIGTAIRHMDSLRQYAEAWNKAKGDINAPILRQAAAHFATAWGSDAPTNLQQAARIAGPEIIKAIGVAGAGTGGERFAQEEGFQPGASNQQILGAIQVAQDFLAGQLPAKEAQARNVGFPHERFIDMVGGHEYDYLTAIRGGKGGEGAAVAKGKPSQMSEQDHQALDWANANQNDPRAAKIKQRLGVQ
jgi:hypothetical protein